MNKITRILWGSSKLKLALSEQGTWAAIILNASVGLMDFRLSAFMTLIRQERRRFLLNII